MRNRLSLAIPCLNTLMGNICRFSMPTSVMGILYVTICRSHSAVRWSLRMFSHMISDVRVQVCWVLYTTGESVYLNAGWAFHALSVSIPHLSSPLVTPPSCGMVQTGLSPARAYAGIVKAADVPAVE